MHGLLVFFLLLLFDGSLNNIFTVYIIDLFIMSTPLINQLLAFNNHLIGDIMIRVWDQGVCFIIILGSSYVVASIIITKNLYDR